MTDASRVNIFKYHEDNSWGKPKKNLPVTIVTGPLGAGKTTTLRHILKSKRNLRIAVAVNDFAAVNVDSELIACEQKDTGVVELTNGCICCSKKGDLVDKVWSVLKDADAGNVDYLVIETSGVTDPCTVVQTLEADFGKMYRIRLDSVVLVLDADEVVSKLDNGEPPVHPHQLMCADAVLLNKSDLVSPEECDKAAKYLADTIPQVEVHRCRFGSVPLDAILEIREATTVSTAAVAHEAVERKFHIASVEEKSLRTAKLADATSDGGHIAAGQVDSMVFESGVPFRLGAFQDFLGPLFPLGVRRIKGWVYFAEDPKRRQWMFHYSGRRRFECSVDRTPAAGERKVRIVLIGKQLDEEAISSQLASATAGERAMGQSNLESDTSTAESDELFEVSPPDSGTTLKFRLTAAKPLKLSLEELSRKHGIDLNRVNTELQERVNYTAGPPFLTLAHDDDGTVWLRYATDGTQRLADIWPSVKAAADVLVKNVFSHVFACRCGW